MKGNGLRKPLVKNKKKRETARARTQRRLIETAKVGTSLYLKQTARERTQELSKNQLASSEAEGKEVEEKEEKRIRRKK